jgi:hypothetical protein
VRLTLVALALALALGFAGAAAAGPVRSEGVGTAPLPGAPGAAPPRQAALDAALANAALRVAESLAGQPKDAAGAAALREALGPNPGRFAVGYRSVSEVERSRAEASGREIAITVEAQIDRTRVEAALRRAGLLAEQAAVPPPDTALRIVVEPLPSWPALAALRRRLVELGAQRVQLERVEPERAVLAFEGGRSASSLVAAVSAAPPPGVAVTAEGERDGHPRIRLEGAPVAPGPIDTPAAKR